MKKKDISFAEEAERIESKYYKIRKPGDDKMTDEAFNREMQQLMEKQESVKAQMQPQSPQKTQGLDNYSPQNSEQLMFGIGGNLPKYDGYSTRNNYLNNDWKDVRWDEMNNGNNMGFRLNPLIPNNSYQKPNINYRQDDYRNTNFNPDFDLAQNEALEASQFATQTQNINKDISNKIDSDFLSKQGKKGGSQYSPTANILGPLLTTATSAISSNILDKNLQKNKANLLKGINVNLGRINPQQIDLGRERANIRSNAALTESSGRYASKGARSASEAAMIQNMARLGGQRVSGDQLSQSYSREELTNADLRQKAAEINMQNAGKENMIEQQQRQDIESGYGNAGARIWSDFAKSTGESIGNYMNESQRMKRDYDYMQMAAPNMEMDYQTEFNKLSPTMQRLARLGIYTPGKNIKVRS